MNKKFFEAIKHGDPQEVQRLISSKPDLIREKDEGLGPIMVALHSNEAAIAELIAEKSGNLTIFEAAALGKVSQITRQLAHDASLVNAYGEDGFQPLGLACCFGHYEAAVYLIKAGAALNSPSLKEPNAAPIQFAVTNRHERIVSLLLDHGADPNVREKNGNTPLHAAAQNNDPQMIRLLLFNGANLSIRNHANKLPIDFAVENGHKEAAGLLKEGITRRLRVKL